MTNARVRMDAPPRTDVLRTTPFALRAESSDTEAGDGLTLDGYAAVFNRKALIDSWEGRFWEDIAAGSMKKSFREMPPKIQFEHGKHPLVGSIPIARLTTIEESSDPVLAPDGGAHVVGRLHDNWLIQPVREAIANGAVDGMSFRFTVVREEWRDADGKVIRDEDKLRDLLRRSWLEELADEELLTRTLKELRVPELGPVVFPAYAETSVGVRSMLNRLGDAERHALAHTLLDGETPEQITDFTGRPDARSAGGGDSGTEPGDGDVPAISTRQRFDSEALHIRGILK
jgi:Escherichia/Staphylococcus phage prohead protease